MSRFVINLGDQRIVEWRIQSDEGEKKLSNNNPISGKLLKNKGDVKTLPDKPKLGEFFTTDLPGVKGIFHIGLRELWTAPQSLMEK